MNILNIIKIFIIFQFFFDLLSIFIINYNLKKRIENNTDSKKIFKKTESKTSISIVEEEFAPETIKVSIYPLILENILFFLIFFTISIKQNTYQITFILLFIISFLYHFILFNRNLKNIKLFLPFLSKSERKGAYYLGRINSQIYTPPFYLKELDLKKHIFITGLTGMGKTNFLKNFITELVKKKKDLPFIIVEFKGDYTDLSDIFEDIYILHPGENFSINIFNPQDEDPRIYAEKLMNMFTSSLVISFNEDLSPQMESIFVEILYNVCADPKRRNWDGFNYYTEKYRILYKNSIPYLDQSIISLKNRLRRLQNGPLKDVFQTNPDFPLSSINSKKIVLDLGSLIKKGASKNDAIFFSNILFNTIWLNNLEHGRSSEIRHLTIIEDSMFFISDKITNSYIGTNYLEDMALLLRGTGECLITVNTRPNISENIMANAGVIISFQVSYDQKEMSQLLNLTQRDLPILSHLNVGECLVKVNSIPNPFLLKIPKFKKTSNPKNDVKKNNKSWHNHKEKKEENTNKKNELLAKPQNQNPLNEKEEEDAAQIQVHNFIRAQNQNPLNEKEEEDAAQIQVHSLPNNTNNTVNISEIIKRNKKLYNPNNIINPEYWKKILKNTETLFFLEKYNFAYYKCEELFKNIVFRIMKNLNITLQNDSLFKTIISKINSNSKLIAETLEEIEKLRHEINPNQINVSEINNYIILLKKILNLFYINKSNEISEKSEDLWKILKEKILNI